MPSQREIQRLALFQDKVNAVDEPSGTLPAAAWVSQGDNLWTIGMATYTGIDSNGTWHETGDTIVSRYSFSLRSDVPELVSTGSRTLPARTGAVDVRSRLEQTVGMLRDEHPGFTPDHAEPIQWPGHARLKADESSAPLEFGWAEANERAIGWLMERDPLGTRASVLQSQIGRPGVAVAWFLESNGYDLHLVDWLRDAQGRFTSFDFTHLQYDGSGPLPDIQVIAHNEHPTPVDPDAIGMGNLAAASRRIVDEYQGLRARDGGNLLLDADQIAYQQNGIALDGETPHLIVAGTGQPADEWNRSVRATALGLLASRPDPSHRQENTIMADNNTGYGANASMTIEDPNGTARTVQAVREGVDNRTTISVDGRPVGHVIADPQGGWNAYEYRYAPDGTLAGANDPRHVETREQAAAMLAQAHTGVNDPMRYQQIAATIDNGQRMDPGERKPVSWPKVNFPNRLVTSYQHTGKDGRVWDKFLIHIPSGTKLNGVPLDGWNLDQFASKRASEDKINGRDVTISFNPERPVELWRKNGDTRETLTIDNAWDLCKAVKAARVAYKQERDAKREQAQDKPVAGHIDAAAHALPDQVPDGARELALFAMNDKSFAPELDKACDRFARYFVEGRYEPDKAVKSMQRITDKWAVEYERQFGGNKDAQRVSDISAFDVDDRKTAALIVLSESVGLVNGKIDSLVDQAVGRPEIIQANHAERGQIDTTVDQQEPAQAGREPEREAANDRIGIDPWNAVEPSASEEPRYTPTQIARAQIDETGQQALIQDENGATHAMPIGQYEQLRDDMNTVAREGRCTELKSQTPGQWAQDAAQSPTRQTAPAIAQDPSVPSAARDEFDTFDEPGTPAVPSAGEPAKDKSKAEFMDSIRDRAKAKMAESREQNDPRALDQKREAR